MEDRIGNALGAAHVELGIVIHFAADKDNIAQNGKQMLMNPLDHFTVDEGDGRCALDLELDAAFALHDADFERLIALEQLLAVIDRAAAIEDGQRAISKYLVQAALAGVEEFEDFRLGQHFELALGGNQGIDNVIFHSAKSFKYL